MEGTSISNLASTLLSCAISVSATWLFAWIYYRRAGNELKNEAAELRRLSQLLLVGLQNAGLISVNWGKDGRPTGINVVLRVAAAGARATSPPPTVVSSSPAAEHKSQE